ncbi:hypothetical protein HOP61_17905 [Halomonas daqingensis]|uniref:Uncharacterized protein n=1 Tax=Billgrantia desiderata TaxID=52021 RepID=A0AAW4YWC0_9GAMM|nr:hypothetical protein [Halomonas desiderata]MCE8053169.1 hypothetical protein [Halomonas desiderata]
MTRPRDPLQRDRLEERLHHRALAGDRTAYLRLRGLRRLWRAQDAIRNTRNHQGETHA